MRFSKMIPCGFQKTRLRNFLAETEQLFPDISELCLQEKEVPEQGNVQKMHVAYSAKPVEFVSLDVIISVGYRVKSQRGVEFRQWASSV